MKDYDKELIEDICIILAADIITSGLVFYRPRLSINEHNISYEEYCDLQSEIIKRADTNIFNY